jgi:hypothetical protein
LVKVEVKPNKNRKHNIYNYKTAYPFSYGLVLCAVYEKDWFIEIK